MNGSDALAPLSEGQFRLNDLKPLGLVKGDVSTAQDRPLTAKREGHSLPTR